jgi:ABC-type branched-subunit amino acid transport system substrate-binding protein
MFIKRTASMIMLLVLMVSILAACGGTAATPGAQTTPEAAAPTTAAEAAPTEAAEEPTAIVTEAAEEPTEAVTEVATEAAEEPTEAVTEVATEAAEETAAMEETATEGTADETATAGTTDETATAGTADETATAGAAGAMAMPNVSGLNLSGIKIASQTPLSGPQAALGTGIRNGAELAVEQMSEQLGMNVTLDARDDQATPDVGASNANAIAADQSILCVAGHLNSGVALAALPTYKNATLTMVSPANTNPAITDEWGGTAYRIVGRDDVQGVVAENFVRDTLKAKTVYILHNKQAYGQGIAEIFRQQAEEDGITVLGFEGTEETATFDAILTPMLAAQPEAVFFGGEYPQAGPILKQMREKGIQAAFIGPDGMDNAEFSTLAGEAAVGSHYTTIAGPPSLFPAAAQFQEDYQAKYGTAAPPFSPQGYDSASVCMLAIAKAAEAAGGVPTRQQVNEAMKTIGTIDGVTGSITFDAKGDRVPATYYVIKVGSADAAEWNNNEVITTLETEPPAAAE